MKKCEGCPFNDGLTEQATMAQNLGCLPSNLDMIKHFDDKHESMSCHERQNKPCAGLSEVRKTKNNKILKYEDWYHGTK